MKGCFCKEVKSLDKTLFEFLQNIKLFHVEQLKNQFLTNAVTGGFHTLIFAEVLMQNPTWKAIRTNDRKGCFTWNSLRSVFS